MCKKSGSALETMLLVYLAMRVSTNGITTLWTPEKAPRPSLDVASKLNNTILRRWPLLEVLQHAQGGFRCWKESRKGSHLPLARNLLICRKPTFQAVSRG